MRRYNGTRASADIRSDLNNLSVLMKRPVTRKNMVQVHSAVAHQHTSRVGLSYLNSRREGGSEYSDMVKDDLSPRPSASAEGATSEEKAMR